MDFWENDVAGEWLESTVLTCTVYLYLRSSCRKVIAETAWAGWVGKLGVRGSALHMIHSTHRAVE